MVYYQWVPVPSLMDHHQSQQQARWSLVWDGCEAVTEDIHIWNLCGRVYYIYIGSSDNNTTKIWWNPLRNGTALLVELLEHIDTMLSTKKTSPSHFKNLHANVSPPFLPLNCPSFLGVCIVAMSGVPCIVLDHDICSFHLGKEALWHHFLQFTCMQSLSSLVSCSNWCEKHKTKQTNKNDSHKKPPYCCTTILKNAGTKI